MIWLPLLLACVIGGAVYLRHVIRNLPGLGTRDGGDSDA